MSFTKHPLQCRWQIFLLLCCLSLTWSNDMTVHAENRVHPLSADFNSVIPNPSLSVFLGRIRQVHSSNATEDGVPIHTGTLTVEVLEAVSRNSPRSGSMVQLPFHQIADPMTRIRNGRDQWNRLDLAEGKELLLACNSSDGGRTWHAEAAINTKSPQDPELAAVRQAYVIEATPGDGKRLLLDKALQSPDITLLSYALSVLGERNVLGRQIGVHTLAMAMHSSTTPPANKKEIGATLTDLFSAPDLDSRSQQLILASLAEALVNETDKQQRAAWAYSLRSCILTSDTNPAHRNALVHAIQTPPPAEVIHALSALEHDPATVSDPDDRKTMAELAHVWQNASKP